MTKLRRKPSPDLTAYQWDGDEDNIPQWVKDEKVMCERDKLYVANPSGILVAEIDDWIVGRIPGDVYVVRDVDREALFDIIDEEITDA
jgi:hypothetical protein